MDVKPGYKMTEVGVIPEDWEVSLLPEISSLRNGLAHEPFVSESGRFICVNSKFISTDGHHRKYLTTNLCAAAKGDVLMVMSDLPNGRALAKTFLVDADHIYAVNQRVCALTFRKDDPSFMSRVLNRNHYFLKFDNGVSQTHLLKPVFNNCPVQIPPLPEQRAIAAALSDVDALIESLEKLIAKKRDVKQATMQQLLTGATRLPGFEGEWEVKRLGEVAEITTGRKDVNQGNPTGQYPFFTCSREHTFSDDYTFDTVAIMIAGNGDVGNLHFFEGKFEAYQRTYVLHSFSIDERYLWYQLSLHLSSSLGLGKVGTSIPYIKMEDLTHFEFITPSKLADQKAIASVLSDLDAEIEALEARRDKTKLLKQGMMQELLTGKTRLV